MKVENETSSTSSLSEWLDEFSVSLRDVFPKKKPTVYTDENAVLSLEKNVDEERGKVELYKDKRTLLNKSTYEE